MSVDRMTAVWKHSKQTKVRLLILLSLADRADEDGYCWPGRKDIAKRARCTERYVTDAIKEIEADGEIVLHERIGSSYEYIVCVGMEQQEIEAIALKRWGGELGSGVKATTRGGGTPQQGGGGTPRLVEPSLETSKETSLTADIPASEFNIVRAYEEISGMTLSGVLLEELEDYANDWDAHILSLPQQNPDRGRCGKEIVIEAMKETFLNIGKVHHKYVASIINNWINNGYRSDARKPAKEVKTGIRRAGDGGVYGA